MKLLPAIVVELFLLLQLQLPSSNLAAPGSSSGERVHIKVHMPEVMRQHTHFHKVYKHQPQPVHVYPPPPMVVKKLPEGKPHVSLLGYTTTASGNSPGGMAPTIMQLMNTQQGMRMEGMGLGMGQEMGREMAAEQPLQTPNYGPALFDNLSQLDGQPQSKDQQPQQHSSNYNEDEDDADTLFGHSIGAGTGLENDSQLNGDFLAALQREYLEKYGGPQIYNRHKRKKYGRQGIGEGQLPNRLRSQHRPAAQHYSKNYLYDIDDEQSDDYATPYQNPYSNQQPSSFPDNDYETGDDQHFGAVDSYTADNAMAFSGQDNLISALPTVDDFLEDASTTSMGLPSEPLYANMYDAYVSADEEQRHKNLPNMWQSSTRVTGGMPSSSYMQQHLVNRPTTMSGTDTGGGRPRPRKPAKMLRYRTGSNAKLRYVQTAPRKKRKNRITIKRHRI
ncbi:uncharacterized protein LOC115623766 [Scaptodrosophila lebanonensis]|uniref:Uncharacterized protein LOC115623766 n=1 Tax=Drosophila lebanonensis TaxID=7225 RepID=A0A6J2TGL7_DROLE|nr:uncharacterized protein LOC115623766 [Scaptodrosophila lebanonensis]